MIILTMAADISGFFSCSRHRDDFVGHAVPSAFPPRLLQAAWLRIRFRVSANGEETEHGQRRMCMTRFDILTS
ncbi:MAG: hypothetical protein ACREUZ_20225, partial [Burkholderiales bacterium]